MELNKAFRGCINANKENIAKSKYANIFLYLERLLLLLLLN